MSVKERTFEGTFLAVVRLVKVNLHDIPRAAHAGHATHARARTKGLNLLNSCGW